MATTHFTLQGKDPTIILFPPSLCKFLPSQFRFICSLFSTSAQPASVSLAAEAGTSGPNCLITGRNAYIHGKLST